MPPPGLSYPTGVPKRSSCRGGGFWRWRAQCQGPCGAHASGGQAAGTSSTARNGFCLRCVLSGCIAGLFGHTAYMYLCQLCLLLAIAWLIL